MGWEKQVMSWWNKKHTLIFAGIAVFVIVIVAILTITGPLGPTQFCTLVGCVGGLQIELEGLPSSTPFEIAITFPSGETQTLNCGGEKDESIPFEKSCSPNGAFFALPPDVKPPKEITVTVKTSAGQWARKVQPKYGKFQPNGEDCPPVCYNANISITLGQ